METTFSPLTPEAEVICHRDTQTDGTGMIYCSMQSKVRLRVKLHLYWKRIRH